MPNFNGVVNRLAMAHLRRDQHRLDHCLKRAQRPTSIKNSGLSGRFLMNGLPRGRPSIHP